MADHVIVDRKRDGDMVMLRDTQGNTIFAQFIHGNKWARLVRAIRAGEVHYPQTEEERGGGQGGDVQENDGLGGHQPAATGGGQGVRLVGLNWHHDPE